MASRLYCWWAAQICSLFMSKLFYPIYMTANGIEPVPFWLWQNLFLKQLSLSIHPAAQQQEAFSDNMAGGG